MNAPHMSPEDFRRLGHAMIDWIADYHEGIEQYPVSPRVKPGEVRGQLAENPPQRGEPFEHIFADFEKAVMPGITHWQSPNWFAYFPANASYPAILGELLSAGLGVNGMLWATSPACTELETHMLDWLREMLDLPEAFRGNGVIQDTASSAVLCALLAARERATEGRANRNGCDGRLTVYTSTQTHSSIEKAVGIAGLGRDRLRLVDVDESFAMDTRALAAAIAYDRAAGLVPTFVCATIGTTASNAVDPVRAIGDICRQEGLWLHVDAAMSGTAAICPELRGIHDGVEFADSYSFNPHKWMLTNFDCSAFWVRERRWLMEALSILPEYLRNQATDSGAVIDYRDWQIPLGRRFRALKLWFVIRHYGIEGLQAMVREHVRMAQALARRIEADTRFELVAPVALNLLCFRMRDADDATNRALLERVNATGQAFLSHCSLEGRYTLRLCIGQAKTTEAHVGAAWNLVETTAKDLLEH